MLKIIPVLILVAVSITMKMLINHEAFVATLPIVVIAMISYLYSLNNPVKHSRAFRIRSYINWLTLGLTYAFLYMGRYNLTKVKSMSGESLMSKSDFGLIFGIGAAIYGISFIINGPLADKLGGKKTMIIGAGGSAIANIILGIFAYNAVHAHTSLFYPFVIVYAMNMYFQSFGAVSIVKVNAAWFHLKERGIFGGIFGTLISLGIFLAFDLTEMLLNETTIYTQDMFEPDKLQVWYAFFIPAAILLFFAILDIFVIKDTPGEAGFEDFHTGDAGADHDHEETKKESPFQLYKRVLTHPIILIMIVIEFSSGILRNGIMHWGMLFAKDVGLKGNDFFFDNWGLVLMVAGISGGFFGGFVSDKFFQSRRLSLIHI